MKIKNSFNQEQSHGQLGHCWIPHGATQFPTKRRPPKDANKMKAKAVDKEWICRPF